MGKDTPWRPGDGAEQTDPSSAAQHVRVGARHFTPEHRSDEAEPGRPARSEPVDQPPEAFDAAYAQWRGANGNRLDADYRRWRAETGQPFSQGFLDWAGEKAAKRRG
jgi:hypothetical protein